MPPPRPPLGKIPSYAYGNGIRSNGILDNAPKPFDSINCLSIQCNQYFFRLIEMYIFYLTFSHCQNHSPKFNELLQIFFNIKFRFASCLNRGLIYLPSHNCHFRIDFVVFSVCPFMFESSRLGQITRSRHTKMFRWFRFCF